MTVVTTLASDIQERLSLAYLCAVAARAGCEVLEPKVDRNGIDAFICPISGAPVGLNVQMKAVSTDVRIRDGSTPSSQLDTPTYDKLRRRDAVYPQLLIIYEMPKDQNDWLDVKYPNTTLRHLAYWIDLRGRPDVATASTAVHVPSNQVFDHVAIGEILTKAHERAVQGLSWA